MKKKLKQANLNFAWLVNINTFLALLSVNSDKKTPCVLLRENPGGIIFSTTGSEFYIHCIYSLIKTPGGIIFSTAGFEFLYALYLFFFQVFLAKKENVKKKVCVKYVR